MHVPAGRQDALGDVGVGAAEGDAGPLCGGLWPAAGGVCGGEAHARGAAALRGGAGAPPERPGSQVPGAHPEAPAAAGGTCHGTPHAAGAPAEGAAADLPPQPGGHPSALAGRGREGLGGPG